MIDKDALYDELAEAVIDMDDERSVSLAQQVIDEGIDAYEAIEKGLSRGMDEVGRLYEQGEYFIPELLLCSDAMYAGINLLQPYIKKENLGNIHKVVLGVVQGDTHDIGKNLVKIMLESAGFQVIDLGRDIPPQQFVDKAEDEGAELIALSTLMTTAMPAMQEVVDIISTPEKKGRFKVIIGGGPISSAFANKIGADAYARNAAEAAKLAKKLVG